MKFIPDHWLKKATKNASQRMVLYFLLNTPEACPAAVGSSHALPLAHVLGSLRDLPKPQLVDHAAAGTDRGVDRARPPSRTTQAVQSSSMPGGTPALRRTKSSVDRFGLVYGSRQRRQCPGTATAHLFFHIVGSFRDCQGTVGVGEYAAMLKQHIVERT